MFQNLLYVYMCMYIYVHISCAIPMPEKNDIELGDDKNRIMAFNTLVGVYKLTWQHM